MNPNWSKLASLGRMLFILFASTFFGALVIPLAADGTIPSTWAAWRPLLAVAGSASLIAEIAWIRSHLAQSASALGIVSTTAKLAASSLFLLLLSCAAAVPIVAPAVDCASAIISDALAGMTIEQIEADAGPKCGADLISVVTTLANSTDAKVQTSPAYKEALKLRAILLPSKT
jgi:hypothetical protein